MITVIDIIALLITIKVIQAVYLIRSHKVIVVKYDATQ